MLRGISGGQKKRLTTAEMLAGPSKVIFADEISTGLDSSTTYQIVQSFRNFTHTRQVGGSCLMYNSSRKQHYHVQSSRKFSHTCQLRMMPPAVPAYAM